MIITAISIIVNVFIAPIVNLCVENTYIVTITDKDRANYSNSSYYLVFTEDEAGNTIVFENTDMWLRGKFNSSDVQGQLKVGHKYKVVVTGFRIPFFDMYQNIVEFEEIF